MDLTRLKMFCAVAESESVVRAAEQLHRVPSNLTTSLHQLEEDLGTDLFIREKQRLRLSPMGHNFLCYALRILALREEALNMAKGSEPAGNLALGSMESTAATRLPTLPTLLTEFHQRYPAVSLALSTGTSGDIIERVRAGTLADALVDGPINVDELNVFHEQMVLISSTELALIIQPADAFWLSPQLLLPRAL